MAVQGISARDFFDLARFAWMTYDNIKKSRDNFANLTIDVECLLITVGSLDKGHTGKLVADYIDAEPLSHPVEREPGISSTGGLGQRQIEVRALRDGLRSVIYPFYVFLDRHVGSFLDPRSPGSEAATPGGSKGVKTGEAIKRPRRPSLRPLDKSMVNSIFGEGTDSVASPTTLLERRMWTKLPLWVRRLYTSFDIKDMNEIRSRFAVQAANLNLFLTRLGHAQMQKQTELLSLRLAEDRLLSQNWEYSRNLRNGEAKFRQDVAAYVHHLLGGGLPFTEQELKRKAVEDRFAQRRREERIWAEEKMVLENNIRRNEELAMLQKQKISPIQHGGRTSLERMRTDEPSNRSDDRREREREFSRRFSLDLDSDKIFSDAYRRLDVAEAAGLLDEEDNNDESRDEVKQADYSMTPKTGSLSGSFTRDQADVAVAAEGSSPRPFPGITVTSAPKQEGVATTPTTKTTTTTRDPKYVVTGGERMQKTPSSPGISRSAEPLVAVPMQHSQSASPQVRPSHLRTASTPTTMMTPPGMASSPGNEFGTTPPGKSPATVRICDQCNGRIRIDEYFYSCSTGKCAEHGSYDLCRKCHGKSYRCRGRDAGTCGPMNSVVVRTRD